MPFFSDLVLPSGVLTVPFPWAGGKSRVADVVWARFGNVDNYVEPFAGSLAVLLRRPSFHLRNGSRIETLNDADHFVANFWRAVRADPEAVARYADWPVSEADLRARHRWLLRSDFAAGWRERMTDDPDHYDAKIAGWWCWGLCNWIGSGWCKDSPDSPIPKNRPTLNVGRFLGGGRSLKLDTKARFAWILQWIQRLSDRLRDVRTLYGDWYRACDSPSTLTRLGVSGVFLDPPYPLKTAVGSRAAGLYANDAQDLDELRDGVLAWCQKWGRRRDIRAAVCGYAGDGYEVLVEECRWVEFAWKAAGGYAGQSKDEKKRGANARRERIWFSPHCLGSRST